MASSAGESVGNAGCGTAGHEQHTSSPAGDTRRGRRSGRTDRAKRWCFRFCRLPQQRWSASTRWNSGARRPSASTGVCTGYSRRAVSAFAAGCCPGGSAFKHCPQFSPRFAITRRSDERAGHRVCRFEVADVRGDFALVAHGNSSYGRRVHRSRCSTTGELPGIDCNLRALARYNGCLGSPVHGRTEQYGRYQGHADRDWRTVLFRASIAARATGACSGAGPTRFRH